MARRRYPINEEKWRAKGHGRGNLADYRPWLNVRSFSSQGLSRRHRGDKTGRVQHFLSDLEFRCYLLLEWCEWVIDIREQYPLHPIEETRQIAALLGYRHPAARRGTASGETKVVPITMTSDFRVTCSDEYAVPEIVLSVKPSSRLRDERTLQKLEIERQYWERRSVPWYLITEHELPEVPLRNIQFLLPFRNLDDFGFAIDDVGEISGAIYESLRVSSAPVGPFCKANDENKGLAPGTSLTLVWHAIATKTWQVDLNEELAPNRPLHRLIRSGQSTNPF